MKISRKNYLNTSVSGRSMVEMLGVLAIIGVLSIGALNGFRYAMDKQKANSILYDVALGFAVMQEKGYVYAEEKIDLNFPSTSGLNVAGWRDLTGDDYIIVSSVTENVCEKLLDFNSRNGIEQIYQDDITTELTDCNETQTLAFKHQAEPKQVIDRQKECEETCSGECTPNAVCCLSGIICNGICCDTGYVCQDNNCKKEVKQGDECTSNENCNGVGSGFYCNISGQVGSCQPTGYAANETPSGNTVKKSSLNWYSAMNYCNALPGFRAAGAADFNCTINDNTCQCSPPSGVNEYNWSAEDDGDDARFVFDSGYCGFGGKTSPLGAFCVKTQ